VQTISKSIPKKFFSDHNFGFCVFISDTRHHPSSGFFTKFIGHGFILSDL